MSKIARKPKEPWAMPIPYTIVPIWRIPPVRCYVSACAAVLDIEALVMWNFVLVEQIGFVIIDFTGRELFAKHYIIEQPLNDTELMERYSMDPDCLRKAIEGYEKVTGDNYVHQKSRVTYTWKNACFELDAVIRQYKPIIWAKGANLERRVFGMKYIINELEEHGCPKYPPGNLHDPLAECRFFSRYIPY